MIDTILPLNLVPLSLGFQFSCVSKWICSYISWDFLFQSLINFHSRIWLDKKLQIWWWGAQTKQSIINISLNKIGVFNPCQYNQLIFLHITYIFPHCLLHILIPTILNHTDTLENISDRCSTFIKFTNWVNSWLRNYFSFDSLLWRNILAILKW